MSFNSPFLFINYQLKWKLISFLNSIWSCFCHYIYHVIFSLWISTVCNLLNNYASTKFDLWSPIIQHFFKPIFRSLIISLTMPQSAGARLSKCLLREFASPRWDTCIGDSSSWSRCCRASSHRPIGMFDYMSHIWVCSCQAV